MVNLEQFEEAYECFKKVSSLKSDFWDVNNNKIKYTIAIVAKARGFLFEQQHWEDALAVYLQMITLNSDFAWRHFNLGLTLREMVKFEEAIAPLKKGIELDISKNTQTFILTIFSGAIATYEDS